MEFKLTKKEEKRYLKFKEKHSKCSQWNKVAIFFIEDEIGTTVKVECAHCQKLKDITDLKKL